MSDITQELLDDLYAADGARERSLQKELGMSAVGTCRRQAQYIMTGTPGNGRTSSIAAIVGTAVHSVIEKARRHRGLIQEQEVRLTLSDGATLLGHVDEIDVENRIVRDWKTSTEGKIAEVALNGPIPTYINQLHLYGAACLEAGLLPDDGRPVTLQLVYIDRNGKVPPFAWECRYDPDRLEDAVRWLHEVKDGLEAGEDLPQDKPVTFCQDWCQYFDICRAPDLSAATVQPLVATEADDARAYLALTAQEKRIKAAKDEVKSRLVGVQGRTEDGVTVRWTEYERAPYTVAGGRTTRLDVRGPRVTTRQP